MSYGCPFGNQGYPDPTDYDNESDPEAYEREYKKTLPFRRICSSVYLTIVFILTVGLIAYHIWWVDLSKQSFGETFAVNFIWVVIITIITEGIQNLNITDNDGHEILSVLASLLSIVFAIAVVVSRYYMQ